MIHRSNLQCRMQFRCSSPTNHHRNIQSSPLKFSHHMHHFFQRRSNQSAQSYDVHLFTDSRFYNLLGRHHYTQVYNFIVVARHNHRHNVLSDVVHITLHRSYQYLSGTAGTFFLFCLNIRLKNGYRLFHGSRGFHYLRQEHFSRTK